MGLMCTWPLGCPYINWMLIFQRCRQQLVQDRAPSREKGQPLCMAQYDRLFSSCRVPGIDQDKQRVVALRSDDNQEGHHLVVAHQGQVRNTHSHTRRHTHTHTHARTHARTHTNIRIDETNPSPFSCPKDTHPYTCTPRGQHYLIKLT